MKENKYDDPSFFEQYGKISRSQNGLDGAGEWYVFREMLPDFKDKTVLDLGCGYGWHCRYAVEQGAASVIGIDISERMLQKATEINQMAGIKYERIALEDAQFPFDIFDVVLSSLTVHYLKSYDVLIRKIYTWLKPGGKFIFSVEHPIFTAEGSQDWIYDAQGNRSHWAVDRYFYEGPRDTSFLGEKVLKYHRTFDTYLNALLKQGFKILEVKEPMSNDIMLQNVPGMEDELRYFSRKAPGL